MSSLKVWDPENTTKEGKVNEMQLEDGLPCLKMKRARSWMQITKGAVMKLYASDDLFDMQDSFNDALLKCSDPQVKELVEEWKSQAEKEKKGESSKREQPPDGDEGDGQEAKKKVDKEKTGVSEQAERLLGDHQEEDDVIKEKADKKKSGKKKTIVSGKREQLLGDVEGDEVKKKKKKARKQRANVITFAEEDDEDEDEDYDDDVDKQESSKKGRKEKNVQTATVRKTRKAERDAEAQEETAKEAQLVERLKVRENVFVDPNEIAVNGITDEGQRKNACTMFLRRYRKYQAEESIKFDGKISSFIEAMLAEYDGVNPICRNKYCVNVAKIEKRKVIFMDGSRISGDENFTFEETSEWFLVETVDESKMWMQIPQIKNLFDVLADFFLKELDSFNSILKNYFGQMEVKLKLVAKLAPALHGPKDIESMRRGDTHFCFMGPPGTGKTTVAELFALGSWLLVESRFGHLVKIEGAGAKGHYVGHTTRKVENLFKAAKGGTLFFDEAYAICSGNEDQYGLEALAAICAKTEPSQLRETNCLVAGYVYDLEESFFGMNGGLRSRFIPFKFAPYSSDELFNVFVRNAMADRFELDLDASEFLKSVLVRVDCQENQCRSMGNLFRDFKDRWSVNRGKTNASSKERRVVTLSLIKQSVSKIIELEVADKRKRIDSEAKLAKMKVQKGGWKDDAVKAFKVSKSGSKSNVATSEKNVVDSLREEKQTKKKLKFVVVSDEEEVVIVDEKEEEKEKKVEEEEEKKDAKKKVKKEKKKLLVANELLSFTEGEYRITIGGTAGDAVVIKSLKAFQFEDGHFYFLLSDFKNLNGTERPAIYTSSNGAHTVDDRRTVKADSPLGKVLKEQHTISLKGGANFIRVDAASLKGKVVKK